MKFNWHQILSWLDNNLLFCLAVFLLLFIPIWPKLPIADILPGYIVRVRLEDVIIAGTFILYLIWVVRKKISWQLPAWQLVFTYLITGLMTIISGVIFIHTIPLDTTVIPDGLIHLSKSLLHWARYLEYFFLAFLFFSTLKNRRQLKIVATAMLIAVAAISIYSIGQKYLYWPVYSTMNREFSKGIRLYLTPHARVQSTFGGHYDFAAYLVLLLPFTLLIALSAPKKWQKIIAWGVHFLGVWALVVSAARTSVIAYFAAVVLIFTIRIILTPRSIWYKIGAWLVQHFLYFAVVGFIIFGWGQDMIERFTHTLDRIEIFHNVYHAANKWRKELPYLLGWKQLPPPENGIAVIVNELGNNDVSPITPTDSQPVTDRPADVYVDVPITTWTTDASGAAIATESARTWSAYANDYGLSMGIRFDSLWPNAWRGFLRNPLLGSAYGTLTKGEDIAVFTEADSTDNNFLRTLGETGLLGFISFYGLIALALYQAFRHLRLTDPIRKFFILGFLGATFGILINATMIDVFAASKVAFTFWMLYGIFYASLTLTSKKKK
jgi:hypothetical protein